MAGARTGSGTAAQEAAGTGAPSRAALRALLAHSPQSGTLPAALRAGASVAGPLVLLAALGRTDLALYATFGAFAAVYGRRPDGSADPRVQLRLAVVLVAAVATGVAVSLSGAGAWVAVGAAAGWAALAAHLSDRQAWRPPGPLFAVFAVGACSAVPVGGAAAAALALGTAAGTAGFALVLTVVSEPLVRRLARRRAAARPPDPAAHRAPGTRGAHGPAHGASPGLRRRVQVVRCAVAVGVAGALGVLTTSEHPYWAAVAAVAPLAAVTLSSQLVRAAHRALGTVAGLGVAAVLLALPLGTVASVAVAALLQVLAELLVVRHYGAAMLVITPLALLMGQLAHPVPVPGLLADRGAETLLGVAVGVVVVLLTRPRRPPAARMAG
ncbi:FUSC family protein [Streptomyces sp. NP160]|uniref:FUSC family protein n=1 Tax=Streptomyces sp. NP160 TaxID=2586637 RepID=UPI0015D656BC|nr:FUSC family protein [Streptomyces sp. NP160]